MWGHCGETWVSCVVYTLGEAFSSGGGGAGGDHDVEEVARDDVAYWYPHEEEDGAAEQSHTGDKYEKDGLFEKFGFLDGEESEDAGGEEAEEDAAHEEDRLEEDGRPPGGEGCREHHALSFLLTQLPPANECDDVTFQR